MTSGIPYHSSMKNLCIAVACRKLWEQESPKIDKNGEDAIFEYFCDCLKDMSDYHRDMFLQSNGDEDTRILYEKLS